MELWIRSQDKETLIKIDRLDVDGNKIQANFKSHFSGCDYVILGTYESNDRALEVLDEIQNILNPKYILDASSIKPDGDSWVENGIIMQNYNANASIEELSTVVYQMPEK